MISCMADNQIAMSPPSRHEDGVIFDMGLTNIDCSHTRYSLL